MQAVPRSVKVANALLAPLGLAIAERLMGQWWVRPGGGITCTPRRIGWRLTTVSEVQQTAKGETELGRLLRRHGVGQ